MAGRAVAPVVERLGEDVGRKFFQSFESYVSRWEPGKVLFEDMQRLLSDTVQDTGKLFDQEVQSGRVMSKQALQAIPDKALRRTEATKSRDVFLEKRKQAFELNKDYYLGDKRQRLIQHIDNIEKASKSPIVKAKVADDVNILLKETGVAPWRAKVGLPIASKYQATSETERLIKSGLGIGYLGRMVIPHLGQPIYTLMMDGAEAWGKAFARVAHDPAAAITFAHNKQVMVEEDFRAIQDMASGRDNKWIKLFDKPGFTPVRQYQMAHAAIAGVTAFKDMVDEYMRSPSKYAEMQLRQLGTDPAELVNAHRTGGQALQDFMASAEERAAFRSVDETFHITRGLKSPPSWETNEVMRYATLYKTFQFRASKFTRDQLWKTLKTGNPVELMKKLAIFGTIYPIVGEMIQTLQNLTAYKTDESFKDNIFDRRNILHITGNKYADEIINAYSHVGALGITFSLIRAAHYRHASDWIAGPVAGLAGDVLTSGEAALKGHFKPGIKRIVHRASWLGPGLAANIDQISKLPQKIKRSLEPKEPEETEENKGEK